VTDPVFHISTNEEFESIALEIFREQYRYVKSYHDFINYLGIDAGDIHSTEEIPFLPVELFKYHSIIDRRKEEQLLFFSSGTTGMERSKHYVADAGMYETSFTKTFQQFYGSPSDYCILALLPSYLERDGSSLVYMAEKLIKKSQHEESGFYLFEYDELMKKLKSLKAGEQKTLVIGVSFAFLELANDYEEDLSGIIFMETGGMKGRIKEITRQELHEILKSSFNLSFIHSEYGMTELLSQAYSSGEGKFYTPPWMKIFIRDSHDPLSILPPGKTGAINIIDLANRYSCSFLATSDIGKLNEDGSFEILGRMDASDIRGCNFLVGM
jgi:phenylacetate-coenzyme A ligase PaaK-like adenylate-forming protein